jgi:hypothetical protein
MRLLDISDVNGLRVINSHTSTPQYAILSHRWGTDEVTLQDIYDISEKPAVRSREGFVKLQGFARKAREAGYEYVWVDTCCIDRSSSVDVAESIGSMFRYYREAAVCYTYLSDVCGDESRELQIRSSRLFTRGWTLQELLAPTNMSFFDRNWTHLGTRAELATLVSNITGIEEIYIGGRDLEEASVAQRMSWASRRETTKPEDCVYSLLGIFDVGMEVRYGEGLEKAFRRLQEELLIRKEDLSLFAWHRPTDAPSVERPSTAATPRTPGVLARSPADFLHCGDIVRHNFDGNSTVFSMSGGSLFARPMLVVVPDYSTFPILGTLHINPLRHALNLNVDDPFMIILRCRRVTDLDNVLALRIARKDRLMNGDMSLSSVPLKSWALRLPVYIDIKFSPERLGILR